MHDARYNLAKSLKDCGDLATSARVYKELLEIQPLHMAALYNLANLYYEQDCLSEAGELYQRVLYGEPTHQKARINLAVIKSKQGLIFAWNKGCRKISTSKGLNPSDFSRSES